jgi:hypothetical protein
MTRAWVGVALGAAVGLLLLLVWPLAAIPLAIVAGWSLLTDGRRLASGGALFGLGVCWLALFNLPDLHPCFTISAPMSPPQVCDSPDLAPMVATSLLAAAAGSVLMLVGARARSARG